MRMCGGLLDQNPAPEKMGLDWPREGIMGVREVGESGGRVDLRKGGDVFARRKDRLESGIGDSTLRLDPNPCA